MNTQNYWDQLSKHFDTHTIEGEIDSTVADNVLIAWPPIIELINKKFPRKNELNALDFGCGTGSFCKELLRLGFKVTGVDYSEQMIMVAKNNSPSDIRYIVGNSSALLQQHQQDVITSIMTLQFIEDIQTTVRHIAAATKKGGLVIFAVFNPEYVIECRKMKKFFWGNHLNMVGLKIPVFIRSENEYDDLFVELNYKKVFRATPPFTESFKKKYPMYDPVHVPEYLILAYGRQ